MSKPLCVAMTGGIASGKTIASDEFARLGVPVIDADIIAREVVAPGSPLITEIRERFGPASVDHAGTLDRAYLRKLIFNDKEHKKALEAIMHPAIHRRIKEAVAQVDAPYYVLVIPLLTQSPFRQKADRVLVIDAPEAIQLERLMQRDGVSENDALAALASQASRMQRLKLADDVVDNDGSVENLLAQVRDLHQRYMEYSRPHDRY